MSNAMHVKDDYSLNEPRVKPPPQPHSIPVPFAYFPSDDGTDENLLVLLHGLGDSHEPFASLGRQLRLPQTAVLALRAPQQIPFLEERAFQWYTSFDPLGDIIPNPDPTRALELLTKVLRYLTEECHWRTDKIHLLGFAQGGSVAAEVALRWWLNELSSSGKEVSLARRAFLGSVVTISGPLLSYPTPSSPCPTHVLLFARSADAKVTAAFKKGFATLTEVVKRGQEGMPRSREEWEPIMRFWSERLSKRPGEGLFEVMTGGTA
ncbi:alpha/beta-hydrolase [Punctularia strigosozonata HHB-11173 SS5]|uniref:alpha/beta-hydrolase n=1 Tax=Punctularia strigosozonata (strain HHB-11173) TaxID=741275 RepID=UPI00044163AB|nr:alpha/beta-hydrolase [Punctularia strigosozonata HHB-11173 SS5]EIN14486.1 alpha/beta-hydrolase [Punctularia strigosozonata HHB-11173 SS5]